MVGRLEREKLRLAFESMTLGISGSGDIGGRSPRQRKGELVVRTSTFSCNLDPFTPYLMSGKNHRTPNSQSPCRGRKPLRHGHRLVLLDGRIAGGVQYRPLGWSVVSVVSCVRYGQIPESGRSYNHRDEWTEHGVSVIDAGGDSEGSEGAKLFIRGEKVSFRGIVIEDQRGSDGEALVLPVDHCEDCE